VTKGSAVAAVDSKSDRTRRRILDAAARTFRRSGYASVTLKDIAHEAGLQAGSLYYHFDTKEALVEEVLAVGVDGAIAATRDAVAALGPGADPLARLRAAIAAHLRVVLSDGAYASANLRILGQVPDAVRRRHLELQRAYGAFWRTLFAQAVEAGAIRADLDLSVVRMLALGALNWSVEWYRDGLRSVAEIAAHASTMILDGLAPTPAARARARGHARTARPARARPRRAPGRGSPSSG
jgi:TetR/AcrR family transcriptional regulator, cholesterol catabolism regulator